ncbi:MAG: arginine--tRNA ligase [Bacteroidota bacterium]
MDIVSTLKQAVASAVADLYQNEVSLSTIQCSVTRKEFEGDFTIVVFPFTKIARKKPELIGEELGNYLLEKVAHIKGYNVIKGFLNLELSDTFWLNFLADIQKQDNYGQGAPTGKKVMVEFASPNTNKPLHLGHIRNILLGWSCSRILEMAGHNIIRVQIINDRGIAICKSMLAWQRFGNGETPESSGIKGDHLVGNYYVAFETAFRQEYAAWQESPVAKAIYEEKKKGDQSAEKFFKAYKNTYFNEYSELGNAAKDMLLRWEAGDQAIRELWAMMNSWVYTGFDETYTKLGVSFDKLYYESDTYLLGKRWVEEGLQRKLFYEKEDGSVWIDLEEAGMDQKLVLRSDGTSVYITQDIGTAQLRYEDFEMDQMVYVVADEQNYHFKVLFEIMKRFEAPYANDLYHLAYGMVDLTTGKMKSREGTVVDADDLMADVIEEARKGSAERGDIVDFNQEEQVDILRKIGLAALKYFIIKVNPRKRMIFNPAESVDLQGQTGPYIQYSYVRINGLKRKIGAKNIDLAKASEYKKLEPQEKELIAQMREYPALVQQAATDLDPSVIAAFGYNLAKAYHRFWHDLSILSADTEAASAFRYELSQMVGRVLKSAMDLLGMEMPDKM